MFKSILQPLFNALPFEYALRGMIWLLRLVGMIPGGRWLLGRCYATEHPSLERDVFGVHFRNPIGVGAGLDSNGEIFNELGAAGFGFVEIGTVTPRPQSGNPTPRVFPLPADRAIIHRTGLPNQGLERVIRNLRRGHRDVVIGCNIAANAATPIEAAPKDYLKLFRNLYQYVDYFTVNISGDGLRDEARIRTSEYIRGVLDPLFDFRRGQNRYRPILLKISPDLSDEEIDRVTDILIGTPLDGVVATTGTRRREGLATDTEQLQQIGSGRMSGGKLAARSVEVVRRIHERSGGNYPIIGTGGMMSPADVQAMFDAGADLVQLQTGLILQGPQLLKEVCRALLPVPTPAAPALPEPAAPAESAEEAAPETAAEPQPAAAEAAE